MTMLSATGHHRQGLPLSSTRPTNATAARSPTSPRSIFQSYWSSPTRKDAAATKRTDEEDVLARLHTLQLPNLPGIPRSSLRFRGLQQGSGTPVPADDPVHPVRTKKGSFDDDDESTAATEGSADGRPHPSCLRQARYSCLDIPGEYPLRCKEAAERAAERLPFQKSVSFHSQVEVLEFEAAPDELVDCEGWEDFFAWGGA